MYRNVYIAVRELCLAFPGTEEVESRGSPNFRVGGKTYGIFALNHHGDGHVALWLDAPAGSQQLYSEMEPEHYFVPPYVGPKGWLGVELNRGLGWDSVTARVREAYDKVAPASLAGSLAGSPRVAPPERPMAPEEIDPFLGERAQEVLAELAKRCAALPETSAASQFGNPVWKAGKKTFVGSGYGSGRLVLQFWVGVEHQGLLTQDPRYSIPAYIGGNGWISLDVEEHADWAEIGALLEQSYRHFALKRMLKALDQGR